MESDGETFKLIIKTMGDSSIPIDINGDAKILELKEKIQAALENIQNEDVLERDNQRIIFRGRLLNNDLKIKDIQNLEREGGVMHVVRLNIPAPGRNDPTAAQRENLEQLARNELVMAKIRSLETLLKNADQCVSYSQRNTNWNERRELQEPENLGEGVMSVKDFGNVAEDFGETMIKWSYQLSRLSNMLVDVPDVNEFNQVQISQEEIQENQDLFKNNMDATKYFSKVCQQFSEFFIPLDHPPRRISTLAARQLDPG